MKKFIILAAICLCLISPRPGLCQLNTDTIDKLETNDLTFSEKAGYDSGTNEGTLTQTLAKVIRIFLGTLGVIFIVIIIMAGWNWFTAGGDAAKIKLAKDRIINASIGLIIIFSAYSITYFVFKEADNLGVIGGAGGNSTPSAINPAH
jgi:type IV secretory pathway VirB2 component (pilin)